MSQIGPLLRKTIQSYPEKSTTSHYAPKRVTRMAERLAQLFGGAKPITEIGMATTDHNRFQEMVAREPSSLRDLPLLVRRAEAAAILGVPLRTFDKHLRPSLNARRIGRMIIFEKGEIIRWAKGKESVGGSISAKIHETESTYALSTSAGSRRSSRREGEILERLRSERRNSTPKR